MRPLGRPAGPGPVVSVALSLQQPGPADGDRILPAAAGRRGGGAGPGAGGSSRGGDSLLLNRALQYGIPFYLQYLAHWPEYFIVAEAPGGELMGYSECGATPRRRVFQCHRLAAWHVWGIRTQELFLLFAFSRCPTGKSNVVYHLPIS